MSGNDVFKGLIEELGKLGMSKAGSALKTLIASADSPWKKTVLALVAEAVKKYGPTGIAEAQKLVDRIKAGKPVDLSFASLRVQSEVLARLQNAEANRKTEAREFMLLVAKTLGQILAAVIKGIVSAV